MWCTFSQHSGYIGIIIFATKLEKFSNITILILSAFVSRTAQTEEAL
jgi:hypothetical protein